MSSRNVNVILRLASAIYFGWDTSTTGEMSVDQDYLSARRASRLEWTEKTDQVEKEKKVYDEISIPSKKFLSSLSVSLFFVFRVSLQVGSNEGTDL